MVARQIACRIESCGECSFWSYGLHGCDNPDWPRVDRFIRDPGTIPACCPLPMAPEEEDDGEDTGTDC
jgi:hypothetical protein